MADTSGSAGEVRVKLALDVQDLRSQLETAERNLGRRRGIPLKVNLEPQTVTAAVNKATGAVGGIKPVTLKASITGEEVRRAAGAGIDAAKGRVKKLPIDVSVSHTQVTQAADSAIDKAQPKKLVIDVEYRYPEGGPQLPQGATRPPRRPPSTAMGGPVRRVSMPPRRHAGGPVGHRHPGRVKFSADDVYIDPRSGLYVDVESGRILADPIDPRRRPTYSPPRRPPSIPATRGAPGAMRRYGPPRPVDLNEYRRAAAPPSPRAQVVPTSITPFPSGRSHPEPFALRSANLLNPEGLRGETPVPASTFGTPRMAGPIASRRLSRAERIALRARELLAQRRSTAPGTRVGGGTPELDPETGYPTGRIDMPGMGIVRPQGLAHSIYGDPRYQFGPGHQRGEIYFDPKGGPAEKRMLTLPTGQRVAVASEPRGEYRAFTSRNRPVVESRVARLRERAREAELAQSANRGGFGVYTGSSITSGGIEPELTPERKKWIEVTNQTNRTAAKAARIDFQARVTRARKTDPTALQVRKVNTSLARWNEYKREESQRQQGFALSSRPETPPEINPYEDRPAYRQFVQGGGAAFTPFSIQTARQMPETPLFRSPMQRMSMVMPTMGRFYKAWEDYQDKPSLLRGARVMKLSRRMTAEFMERLAEQVKTPLANSAMQRHLNEQYRLGLIESYDSLVEGGHISGEGDLSKEGRDFLKSRGHVGLGRTKTSLPRKRRGARNPKRDEMYGVIYDEQGNPMEHLDGPMAGQVMMRISPADLFESTAMSLAVTSAAQPLLADQMYDETQADLAAYEAKVKAQWKKKGTYGSSDPLPKNAHGRWTLSDARFKEFYKNDSERERLRGVLQDLQKRRFRQENAGERLKSKAMGGSIGDPLEMPPQGGWWSRITNTAANAARSMYWDRSRLMQGRIPGANLSFAEILGRASSAERREIGRSTPPFMDDLRGSWTRELDAMGWVRGREGPFPGAQAMPEGLPMQWTKGFTSDAYKSKLWQKFQAGDPESRQVMGALAGIRGRYPAREGFEDLVFDPSKISRNAMGGGIGPLGRRLAQANIQKAYDEGRYEEGQQLQLELEKSLGGWHSPAKPQTMSPYMRLIQEGKAPPKDMTRAMGGPVKRAGMGMRQLAPNWSGGVMPLLAMHPDAVLVGEHGPEVFVPETGGDIYPNHYNGGYLPQFHSGGRLPQHQHPHQRNAQGQEVYQDPRGSWRRVTPGGGNLADPYAQAPQPIQGINPAQAQAAAPQAAGQQPPNQPPQPPVAPPPGSGPNAAGGRPPRLSRATPVQSTRGFIATQENLGEMFRQIDEIRQEASNALQLSPVRALSVSVGQIFQERFGGRRGIRSREAIARNAAGDAQALLRRLESQQTTFRTSIEQIRSLREEARLQRSRGEDDTETRQRIGLARERARGARAGAQLLQGPVEESIIRAQILERGEARTLRTRPPQESDRVRAIAQQMRDRGEGTGGILTTRNLLQAQGLGLAGIVVGTKIFTAGIQAVDAGLALANQALAPMVDSLTGFRQTADAVVEELSKVAGGGTGGRAEIAGAQARIGISTPTPGLERRAQLLAGAENFAQIQAALRAERNLGTRSPMQGVFSGFNNGPLAGIPVLGDLFGWIGQTQSIAQRLEGPGRRSDLAANPFLSRMSDEDFTALAQTGIATTTASGNRQFVGSPTVGAISAALPGSGMTPLLVAKALGLDQATVSEAFNAGAVGGLRVEGGRSPEQQAQIDEVNALWAELNDNLDKVNPALGDFVVTLNEGSEASKQTAQEFRERGMDTLADIIEDFGIEFLDQNGRFVDRVEEAVDAAATGATFQDPGRILTSMMPALQAQVRGIMREAQFSRETVIPAQLSRQLAANPLPTSGRVGLIPAGVGNFTGLGMLEEAASTVAGLRQELEGMALSDEELGDRLGVPQEAIASVREIGEEIRRLSEIDQDLQLGIEQEQYNEQLRISRRGIGDLVGLVGRQTAAYSRLVSVQDSGARVFGQQVIAATEYGRLQRAQIADSRQLSQIQLARGQRELNLQLALARLRSPGETAAERAVRRREAEALAREQQQELNINRRSTRRGFRIEDIGFRRQLGDALRAQGLSESERTIQLRIRGSQAVQRALGDIQEQRLAFLDLSITVGQQLEDAAMKTQQAIEEASGQFLDDFSREVRRTLRTITNDAIESYDRARATIIGGEEGFPVPRGRGAAAAIAASNRDTGGPGGGGRGTINININASVREDGDVDRLVRRVIREIHQQSELIVG